jgi:hypothetical protein
MKVDMIIMPFSLLCPQMMQEFVISCCNASPIAVTSILFIYQYRRILLNLNLSLMIYFYESGGKWVPRSYNLVQEDRYIDKNNRTNDKAGWY